MKIKFNRVKGQFERGGKPLRLDADGASCLSGWIFQSAKSSPKLAKNLESFANFSFESGGKNHDNLKYFQEFNENP